MPKASVHLPRIAPVAPIQRAQPFNDPAWLFEPKYDGFRGMVYLTRRSCTILSKKQNVFSRFEELRRDICGEIPKVEAIIDGEIVAIDEQGRVNFWDLMRGRGQLHYAAFDLLWLNGRDLRRLPLIERKQRLRRLIPRTTSTLSTVFTVPGRGCDLFEAACQVDFEGIVAKQKAGKYDQRTRWWKIKNPTYTQAEGRRELFERRS